VMFWTPEVGNFWTHLTAVEFAICFPGTAQDLQ
jgi:hypothetical protein